MNKANRCWIVTLSLSADAMGTENVFNALAVGHQVATQGIRKETEPSTVCILLAAF
jgi:hypothetical protein